MVSDVNLHPYNAVDRMRRRYEREHGHNFEWVVNARPDNVYVQTLPDLRGGVVQADPADPGLKAPPGFKG